MEILFWLSIFLIAFAYFGYPVTLKVLNRFFGKTFTKLNIFDDFFVTMLWNTNQIGSISF